MGSGSQCLHQIVAVWPFLLPSLVCLLNFKHLAQALHQGWSELCTFIKGCGCHLAISSHSISWQVLPILWFLFSRWSCHLCTCTRLWKATVFTSQHATRSKFCSSSCFNFQTLSIGATSSWLKLCTFIWSLIIDRFLLGKDDSSNSGQWCETFVLIFFPVGFDSEPLSKTGQAINVECSNSPIQHWVLSVSLTTSFKVKGSGTYNR